MPISEVYNMDCLIGMKRYPNRFFDLAIVDPPYGIGIDGYTSSCSTMFGRPFKSKGSNYKKKNWDNQIPDLNYWNELFRVSKNQIVWGGNYFTDYLKPSRGWIFWYKHTNGNFADGELAWTSFDQVAKCFDFKWNGLLQQNMKDKEERIHPTQKPVALYRWILEAYAYEGYKIIDTHAGSQSSRIAAFRERYDYVGFEIDEEYFDQGNKRFKEQTAQIQIF